MKLLFVHGWGFDNAIWAGIAGIFPDSVMWDRGYLGATREPAVTGPFVAVTHSFGTMRLLASLPSACRGVVAINGFDRFCEADGFPGVQRRVIDRMIARFATEPQEVLGDFRRRCGCDAPWDACDQGLLREDLLVLRDGDCREQLAGPAIPVLSLQGAQDPIARAAMREAVFATAGSCERVTIATGGHLLPLQESATCADAISAFMKKLT